MGRLRPWAPAKSDLGRNVMRPFLGGIEAGDADRIFVLSVQQSDDDGFQIGRLDLGLSPYPAKPAEIAHYEVGVLIVVAGHDRRRPVGPTHLQSSTPQNRDSSKTRAIRSACEEQGQRRGIASGEPKGCNDAEFDSI